MGGIVTAALWMGGALLSFVGMAIAGRELSVELNTFQILFFRSLIGLLIVVAILARVGWTTVRTRSFGLHAVRNTVHFGGQFGWFFAISMIPLTQVFALEFTVPIWTAVFAVFLLGERITAVRALAIGLGFAGILVILRPGMIPIEIGILSALAAAVCYALSHTLTKRITGTDTPIAVIFYMTVLQLPMGLVPSLMDWTTPSLAMAPWLILVGITGLSAHYCMSRAFLHADAVVVVPMDFLRLPLIAVIGFVVYREPFEVWVLAGAAVICAGILVNMLAERTRR